MLLSKSELDTYLTSIINRKSFDPIAEEVIDFVYKTHNIPKGILADFTSGRRPMVEADEVLEYCLLEALIEVAPKNKKSNFTERMTSYYTAIEQKKYAKWKRKSNAIKYPIVIPCFAINDDQWIGYADMKFLMQLRAAQLIRYNENAQRVMKRKVSGNSEEYVIAINRKAIREIKEAYEEGTYIPNTITLNIPEDLDSSYKYDEATNELIINSLESFDITDGYHRYIAACELYDDNNEFNTPIELRITRFSDEKARGFIYQEDQKTKMTKIESESMNVNSPANIITERLNSSSTSNFKGLIKRNGGIIDFATLSMCISNYLIGKQKIGRPELIALYKEIEEFLNKLSDNDTKLITTPWDANFIRSTILVLAYNRENNVSTPKTDLNTVVNTISENYTEPISIRFSKKDIEGINNAIKATFKS